MNAASEVDNVVEIGEAKKMKKKPAKAPKIPLMSVVRGVAEPSVRNVQIALMHPNWRGVFAFDVWANRVRIMKAPPRHALDGGGEDPKPMSFLEDKIIDRVAVFIDATHQCNASRDTVARAIELTAEGNAYHPVKTYLEGLQWDGKKRLHKWLIRHARVEDTPYTRAVGKLWMISAVARIYEPGCQADYVLILEGDQRCGKSSLFRALCHDVEWFLETTIELGSKDSQQLIRSKWIVELSELDSLTRGEFNRTKAFITMKVDSFRKSYGRLTGDYPRGCIFGGTVNEQIYLKDDTGGGRWWPVWTPATQTDRLDTARLIEERDQLWAEAKHLYKQGVKWHPEDPELIRLMQTEQEKRRQTDPWEEAIAHCTTLKRKGAASEGVSILSILADLGFEQGKITKGESMRVARTLRILGWVQSKTTMVNGKKTKLYTKKV